jgi:hypothetical protein
MHIFVITQGTKSMMRDYDVPRSIHLFALKDQSQHRFIPPPVIFVAITSKKVEYGLAA